MKDDDLTAAYMAGFERGKEMTASERAKLELFDAMVETLRAAHTLCYFERSPITIDIEFIFAKVEALNNAKI